MAKNVGFCVFLALLASFSFFFNCTGETANNGEKGGNNINMPTNLFPEQDNPPDVDGTFPGLSATTELQIKQDFIELFGKSIPSVEHVVIVQYFGTYNGYIALMIYNDFTHHLGIQPSKQPIAGMMFYSSPQYSVSIWKHDGINEGRKFMPLKLAYDLNIMTEDDIRNIFELYQQLELYPLWVKYGGN